jgi:hypothetical protein
MAKKLEFDDYKISNLRYAVTTVSGVYIASLADYVIISSGISITLPMASTNKGRMYIIKSTSSNISLGVPLPLNPAVLTVTSGTCMHVISDGTTWVDITPG